MTKFRRAVLNRVAFDALLGTLPSAPGPTYPLLFAEIPQD